MSVCRHELGVQPQPPAIPTLPVAAGARRWYHSIRRMRFPISILYGSNTWLAPFLILLAPKRKFHIFHSPMVFFSRISDHGIKHHGKMPHMISSRSDGIDSKLVCNSLTCVVTEVIITRNLHSNITRTKQVSVHLR